MTSQPSKFGLTALLLLGLFAPPARAQTRPEITAPATKGVETIMFVGNSFFYYNNGISNFVRDLANGTPPAQRHPLRGTMVTIGGSGFDWHDMDDYFRPHAIGYYTFDKDNHIVFNNRARYYDAVLMMDCSQCPIHPQLGPIFVEYAKKNAEIVRRHGSEPMLFMSWAYQDKPEMTAQLAEAYTKAGNDNHELVIPAGLAFARVVKERPDLVLYQHDRRHPTPIGSYLAAAVVYSAILQQSPEPNTYTAGLDPAVAQYLRHTAWQVTQDYYTSK